MKPVTIDPRYHDAVIFYLDGFVADTAALDAVAGDNAYQLNPRSTRTRTWVTSPNMALPGFIERVRAVAPPAGRAVSS